MSAAAVWQVLSARASRHDPAPVLIGAGQRFDAGALVAAIERTVHALRHARLRCLALRADNAPSWVVIDLACQLADIRLVPLAPFFSPQQAAHVLTAAGCDALASPDLRWPGSPLAVGSPAAGDLAGLPFWRLPVAPVDMPDGTTKITFTSGSTGAPKGVCLSADHPQRVAASLATLIDLPGVRHLCLLPLATLLENVGGVYAPLLSNGTVYLPSLAETGLSGASSVDMVALTGAIDRHQPHSLILVPALLQALVGALGCGWHPPRSLCFVAVGGARVAPALLDTARRGGLPVYEGYGLSECASVVSLNTPGHDQPGSAGRPLPHLSVTIDNGELTVGGSGFLGYLGQPESWYPTAVRSGDVGHLDADGFLHVRGRRDNLIVTSFGRNVSPEWVEAALLAGPLLRDAVVFGNGETHCAALLGTANAIGDDVLDAWVCRVNADLPDYARIGAFARLPAPLAATGLLTGNGRPRRAAIAERYADVLARLFSASPPRCSA
jgi:long-subunit acyl-CoA synthetase (AMP-forming)